MRGKKRLCNAHNLGRAVAGWSHRDSWAGRSDQQVSIGPLLQLGFTDDLALVGLSSQGKYAIGIPELGDRFTVILQGGIGFVHADKGPSDTSFLIPIGVGVDYQINPGLAFKSDFLLNFTDLEFGRGRGTPVFFIFVIICRLVMFTRVGRPESAPLVRGTDQALRLEAKVVSEGDRVLIAGLIERRSPRQDPQIVTIRSTDHRKPVVGVDSKNPIIPLVG